MARRVNNKKKQKEQPIKKKPAFDFKPQLNVLNKDVFIHIFASLDVSTLGSILLACKEFYMILQDESVWKKLSLIRFPLLKSVNIEFPNEQKDAWRTFYVNRVNREGTPARMLQQMHDEFQQSGSKQNLSNFLAGVKALDTYTQVAGYFPNTKYKDPELKFLADTIVYTRTDMEVDNMIGYKDVETHVYNIEGTIIGLDGKQHEFQYSHDWHYGGQDRYTNVDPNFNIGECDFKPEMGEVEGELKKFIAGVRKLLAVKKASDKNLFEFVSDYMISSKSIEDLDELWGEIEEVLDNGNEENEDQKEDEEDEEHDSE